MSNQSTEKEYDNVNSWFRFCLKEQLKALYICLPGSIVNYNSTTKRAQIQVALDIVKTDGTTLPYPVITDVPVVFPASSQYLIQFPLVANDPVLVLFSQRGLNSFKLSYQKSEPDKYGFFSLKDAVAIPGFGQITETLAQSDALTIQTATGDTAFILQENTITIKATTINLEGNVEANSNITAQGTVNAPTLQGTTSVEAQTLSIDGAALPTNHRHGGVQTGGGNTGTPIA